MDPAVAAQLQSLKAKWAPQSAGGAAFSAAGAADGSGVASVEQFELADQRRLEEAKEAQAGSGGGAARGSGSGSGSGDKLSNLIICRACQGAGMIDEQYNHMVISKTCTTCDGDGIVPRPGYAPVGESEAAGTDAATALALKKALGEDAGVDGEDDDVPPLENA